MRRKNSLLILVVSLALGIFALSVTSFFVLKNLKRPTITFKNELDYEFGGENDHTTTIPDDYKFDDGSLDLNGGNKDNFDNVVIVPNHGEGFGDDLTTDPDELPEIVVPDDNEVIPDEVIPDDNDVIIDDIVVGDVPVNPDEEIELPDDEATLPDNGEDEVEAPDENDGKDGNDEIEAEPNTPEENEPENGEKDEDNEIVNKLIKVDELYSNSQADGGGSMLWMLNVSFNDMNASDLLAQEGKYLVFKLYLSEDSEGEQWVSFAHAFYLPDTDDNYNSTGFMNKYIHSIQFAVVDVAPDDEINGTYSSDLLNDANFVEVSEIFYNTYFNV